jgi:hypothetical protein
MAKRSFFVATDQELHLNAITRYFKGQSVCSQQIDRSSTEVGIHFMQPFTKFAYQNAIDMIVDIELLSQCKTLFAFPGSQIYWWLSIKRQAESLCFELIDVLPGKLDRLHWIRHLMKTKALFRTCKVYAVHSVRELLN